MKLVKGQKKAFVSIDQIVRKYTMWKSLSDAVVDLLRHGNDYTPSIYTSKRRNHETTRMADALDYRLQLAGSAKRVWRGD